MLNSSEILNKITPIVQQEGCFVVSLNISKDNDIELIIEKESDNVEMDNCVNINKKFLELFDRDIEDYSLTVSSSGDLPFKVLKQFQKAIGTIVEVSFKGGKRLLAELTQADENSITLKYSQKEKVEGKNKKELVQHIDNFDFKDINSVKPFIDIE